MALGVAHVAFGLVHCRVPLREAVSAGFIGKFTEADIRRTAFWFIVCGPMFMLAGHVALHAVNVGDLYVLKLICWYMLVVSVVGVIAFPVSPLWAPLALAPLLIAAGYGKLS